MGFSRLFPHEDSKGAKVPLGIPKVQKFGIVQILLILRNAETCILSCYRSCPYSRERASRTGFRTSAAAENAGSAASSAPRKKTPGARGEDDGAPGRGGGRQHARTRPLAPPPFWRRIILLTASPTLDGSFSAVWTATIASKDAFFCIFHNLQDLHSFAPLQSQNW